ncbi:MAG: MarR family transcriptional regulator [Actinomycetia bacterium]|nr:MarR family transcriptional regulator [Actinomycetes bacterium]
MVPELRIGVTRLSRRLRSERPDDDSLTPSQLAVLGTLVRNGPMRPGELAAAERVRPPSMTRILAHLMDEGMIEKTQDPQDGRQVLIELTSAAAERIQSMRQRKDAYLTQALAQLSPQDRDLVLRAGPLLSQLALQE